MENNKEGELELKAYVFTEKHLSSLDKGIQAAHALLEFRNKASEEADEKAIRLFNRWSRDCKTIILLDGGNTHDLEEITFKLCNNNVPYGEFAEPDLDGIVTAVAVIADERVYDKKKYPDFNDWLVSKGEWAGELLTGYLFGDRGRYKEWLGLIGDDNLVLRELINNRRLAR